MSDQLFELYNYFYLGNLASAVNEGETASVDDQKLRIERDLVLKRIDLERGNYDAIISSVTVDAPPALQVVKMLAELASDPSAAARLPTQLDALVADDVATASPGCLLMCAVAYARLDAREKALRVAHRAHGLEGLALKVQLLIAMDRVDVADKEVAAMQAIDEDATLTQLAAAWTHVARGPDSAQDALYVFQDLLERHGATDQILNGMAVCHLAMAKPDDAERVLREALTKNPNCPTSLVNVICSSNYKNKSPELVARYFEQLARVAPTNAWLVDYKSKEAEFDQLCKELSVE